MEVKLHDIGEGMTEADINCYFVKEGDMVKADDPLVEVQTDKMTAEIPAPRTGTIKKILLNEGATVKVGTTLLIMEAEPAGDHLLNKETEVHSKSTAAAENEAPFTVTLLSEGPAGGGASPSITKSKPVHRILASPYTRKIARENRIDLSEVTGTGPGGRITDDDVLEFLSRKDDPAAENKPKLESVRQVPLPTQEAPSETIPFRGRRKQIGKKMAESLYTIPHCTHFEEIDVSELISFTQELKTANTRISATAFFIKALSVCLKKYPVFNAILDEENESIRLIKEHHIGIAVDAPEGLIVPVVKNADKKNLTQIHEEMKNLTARVLEDKLNLHDITGGTFTISNVGPLGGSIGATPIIQHPQTALVSFHKTKKRPVVNEKEEIVIRSIMNISMSFDHRVADGAKAVSFTNRFAELIENPKMLLLELI